MKKEEESPVHVNGAVYENPNEADRSTYSKEEVTGATEVSR